MVLYIVPIFAQVADSVAHSVCIFAKEERLVIAVAVRVYHALHRRVHARVHVCDLVLSLIVYETRVKFLHRLILCHYITAPSRLVAERPKHHRRMVSVTCHHAHSTVYVGGSPRRIVRQRVVAMTLLVCLVHHIQSVVVV